MKSNILIVLLVAVLFSSCKKEAGEGGRATITGKVYAEYWDKTYTIKGDSGYAPDVDVYIIYGDNVSYGNRIKANYDGTYEFKYLQKGDYKVFVYSKDSTGRALDQANGNSNYLYNPDVAIIKSVSITERKQKLNVEDIRIFN